MINKRDILVISLFGLLIWSFHIRDIGIAIVTITSLLLLTIFEKITSKLGFTNGVLSHGIIDIDGEKHTIDLQGFSYDKTSKNIVKVMVSLMVSLLTIVIIASRYEIEFVIGIITSMYIPITVLIMYLFFKAIMADSLKIGTTTIEVKP